MSTTASTQTISSAQSGSWYAEIEDLGGVTFKLKNFYVPGVGLPNINVGSMGNWNVSVPGTKLIFENSSFEFSIDADWKNYQAAFEWMITCATQPLYKKITIYMLDGSKQFQNVSFVYHNCKPIHLTPILMDAVNTQTVCHCSLDIAYDYFSIVTLHSLDLIDNSTTVNSSTGTTETSSTTETYFYEAPDLEQ